MSSTRDAQSFACDGCRARKSKCSKERPICTQCRQLEKQCVYSAKVIRSPLTRQHLTYVEDRLNTFETAFAVLFPGSDIEAVANSLLQGGEITQDSGRKPSSSTSSSIKKEPETKSLEPSSEAVPQQADGFDWVEKEVSLGELADGMAALSVRPEGAGYLGSSSSVVPLRALRQYGFDLNVPIGNTSENAHPRRIPLKAQLLETAPTGLIEQAFIDSYFMNYHTGYPFVHEATFRAQYNEQIPRSHGSAWQILLNTILALGAWCVGDDNSDLDISFYQEARRHLQQACAFERGNPTLVQALLLLSNYAQKRDKPNTGWNYLGLAVRAAMSLGLHREFPAWKITLLQREMRRRLWWGVYIFDSGAAKTFGRPILLPKAGSIDAERVLNIRDESLTPETTNLPPEVSGPTLYSGIIAQSKFHLETNWIYERLISSPALSALETLALQKNIDEWYNDLPAYLTQESRSSEPDWLAFVRSRLMWRQYNFRILLYRPIVLRWAARRWSLNDQLIEEEPSDGDCRYLCLESARSTISSISDFMERHFCTRVAAWYSLYFLFQAAVIPIIFLTSDPASPDAPSWLQDVERAKQLLIHPSLTNNRLAARCLAVIARLCAAIESQEQTERFVAQQEYLLHPSGALLSDPVFGILPDDMQAGRTDMDISEWMSFAQTWNS